MSEEERGEKIIDRFEQIASLFGREVDLVMVEEFASEIGRQMARKIPKLPEIVTRRIDRDNVLIKNYAELINSRTRGRLREFVIKSPSTNFRITVMRDGTNFIDRTYTELVNISPQSETIDAYEEAGDGVYVVVVKNINWLRDFTISIRTTEDVTFTRVFSVWDEYV